MECIFFHVQARANACMLCSDGLHFTPAGNKILFYEVVKKLAGIGFSQECLPSDLPLFHEIDPKDPMKALY
jgi:isoamyl acetate esterase